MTDEDHDGLEIIFINVGKNDDVGDSILLRNWDDGEATCILIDGGKREAAESVISFLERHDATEIDHMVCSHFHDDHAGGLIEVLDDPDERIDVQNGWMHLPSQHTDEEALRKALSQAQAEASSPKTADYAKRIEASLDDADDLERAFRDRGIEPDEPFQGKEIGFIQCLGPSKKFYKQNLEKHKNRSALQKSAEARFSIRRDRTEAIVKSAGHANAPGWPDSASTSAANNTSTVFEVNPTEKKIILTADAGVAALDHAHAYASLSDAHFAQIPHHGSRHNLTEEWVERLNPSYAYVSAPGNKDADEDYYVHPAKCVVNEFQDEGADVYSTHKSGTTRRKYGSVPEDKWSDVEPLVDDWPND